MTRFTSTLLATCFLVVVEITVCTGQETTWESAPISTQLEMDDTIIPFGKGAIFCPSMTDPDNEPVYGVLQEGKMIQD